MVKSRAFRTCLLPSRKPLLSSLLDLCSSVDFSLVGSRQELLPQGLETSKVAQMLASLGVGCPQNLEQLCCSESEWQLVRAGAM